MCDINIINVFPDITREMPDTIIKVKSISKRYRIGAAEKGYKTFREAIMKGFTAPIRNFARLRNLTKFKNGEEEDAIWALKDISFEVKKGEVLGIIGKNGSGKSTLLKILSRITEPTSGFIEIYGQISSLLEVGTGFHPELTGRENIFLNGGILGMRKKEIESKFDDIVSFSEIGKFIDTPVKRYSSGMYVRLAFAVAAHLEPEILLVDEVLAVGDAEFQKKCLGKMENLAGSGKTVLFVSHNMGAIKNLCHRTILLSKGTVAEDGATEQVVKHYLGSGLGTNAERKWDDMKSAPGDDAVRLRAVRAKNAKGEITSRFSIQEPVYIEAEFNVLQEGWVLEEAFSFYNETGLFMFASLDNADPAWRNRKRPAGLYRSICNIPGNFLNEGTIIVTAAIVTNPHTQHASAPDAISFQVFDPGSGGARGDFTLEWPDVVVRPLLDWNTEYTPNT
jgi:lipopolysaccharide transport system ATP-binding protein